MVTESYQDSDASSNAFDAHQHKEESGGNRIELSQEEVEKKERRGTTTTQTCFCFYEKHVF